MTRRTTMLIVAAMVGGLVLFDLSVSATPNPFHAPPLLALGSGLAAGGAHCAALPPSQ
jgi:hypothetical protein